MDRRPLFQYGASSEWEASISSPSWLPGDRSEGGSDISSAGIPAAYTVRRDDLAFIRIQFWESEWAAVKAMVNHGQTGQILTWYPDADEPANFQVYLEEPAAGQTFQPQRLANFPRVFELALVLRNADATAPWTPYFADPVLS